MVKGRSRGGGERERGEVEGCSVRVGESRGRGQV